MAEVLGDQTNLNFETPGPSLAKMEGNSAVIARVSDIVLLSTSTVFGIVNT